MSYGPGHDGISDSAFVTEIGEKICNTVGKILAKMLSGVIQGFSLAIGALLAWELCQWLVKFYGPM